MDSQPILGKRGRARVRQLQFHSARSQFEKLLPRDTAPDILDTLAKELPLHFFALSLITRGNKKLNSFAEEIYAISGGSVRWGGLHKLWNVSFPLPLFCNIPSDNFYEPNENHKKTSTKEIAQPNNTVTTTNNNNNNNDNNNDQNKIDEKVDEKPVSGALEACRNFRKMRRENPDFDASFW